MHPRSLFLSSALLVSALGLPVGAVGVPVLPGDADAAGPTATAETGRAAPASLAPPIERVAPAQGGESRVAVPRTGRGGPGPVAAAETTPAQAVGAPFDPAAPRARANVELLRSLSPSKPAVSAGVAGNDDGLEIDPDLKQAVKTALDWTHDAKQWVQSANKGAGDGVYKDAAASGEHGPGSGVVAVGPGTAAVNSSPGSDSSPGSETARLHDRDSAGDTSLVRDGIKLIRDLAEHPVTWLLLPIAAFGMLAWRALLHRAQAGTHRVKGREGRRVRAHKPTVRRPGAGRSAGPSAGPSSIRRSDRG